MKKSELKNLIKESIKDILFERSLRDYEIELIVKNKYPYREFYEESDEYMNAQDELQQLLGGEEEYNKFDREYDTQEKDRVFNLIKDKLEVSYILGLGKKFIHYNDSDSFNYFGFWVYNGTKKGKIKLIVNTKYDKYGKGYNPYDTTTYENITEQEANKIMKDEAIRMLKIGTYNTPLSLIKKKIKELKR